MGRPRKNNLDYFSYEWNAGESLRFAALHAHYGGDHGFAMEARFWRLNGYIAHADGCHLDLNLDFVRPGIAQKLGLTVDEFNEFIAFLANPKLCGLIHEDNGTVWTERTQSNLEDLNRARETDRKRDRGDGSGKGSTPKDHDSGNSDSHTDNHDTDKDGASGNSVNGKENLPKRDGLPLVQPSKAKPTTAKSSEQQGTSSASPPASPPLPPPLSIVAVEEQTAAAHFRIPPLDLKAIYDALDRQGATVACLEWILGNMPNRHPDKPAAYLLSLVTKHGYIAKWRESLLAAPAGTAAPGAEARCPHCAVKLKADMRCPRCDRQWVAGPDGKLTDVADLPAPPARGRRVRGRYPHGGRGGQDGKQLFDDDVVPF